MYNIKSHSTLAIDYDDTYSLHPEVFEQVAKLFKDIGWHVLIVTARANKDNSDMPKFKNIDSVIYCNGTAKMDVVNADIWIDDCPLAITHHFNSGFATPNKYVKTWLKEN